MGWSKEWPSNNNPNPAFDEVANTAMSKASGVPWPDTNKKEIKELGGIVYGEPKTIGWDLDSEPNKTSIGLFVDGNLEQVYNNLKPTHDPYTNPGAFVYYECNCGEILDPKTKSFAGLNNAAMNAGWKIRWKQSGEGYQPYCPKCGEGVE